MLQSRLSTASLFCLGSVLLGTCALSAAPTPIPITGTHNGQEGSGYAPPPGNYTVEKDAKFDINGTRIFSAGLELYDSSVLVRGGEFVGNYGKGLYANRTSVIANAGTFAANLFGVVLDHRSQMQVNGGVYENDLIDIALIDHSSLIINRGSFYGVQTADSEGIDVAEGSACSIKGGEFAGNWNAVVLNTAAPSSISGGIFYNNVNAVKVAGTNLWIAGGQFFNNGRFGATVSEGEPSNGESGPKGVLRVDNGAFYANNYGGVGVHTNSNTRSTATINGGTFLRNGSELPELQVAGLSTSAGLRVSGGGSAVINGGQFHLNEPAAVQVLETRSLVTINDGDFRSNGRDVSAGIEAPAPKFADGAGLGVYVHSEAKAVVNGGNFSNNSVGLDIGLPYLPDRYAYAPGGQAVVNGGIFHDSQNAVRADSGSVCTIKQGDFQAPIAITSLGGSKIRVFGGSYRSTAFDFEVYPGSVIELTGVFDGYDNSHGDIVLSSKTPPLIGKLHGRLQNSAFSDSFTFRVRAGGRLILHPTNAPVSNSTVSPSAGNS